VEAKNYLDKTLPVEKRLEAAVAIVKKAYSEVPSYDAILDAALKVPLQEFHKVCTLTPGIPVSPMLAKPTKSVQEVLKRLTGLKFTVRAVVVRFGVEIECFLWLWWLSFSPSLICSAWI